MCMCLASGMHRLMRDRGVQVVYLLSTEVVERNLPGLG